MPSIILIASLDAKIYWLIPYVFNVSTNWTVCNPDVICLRINFQCHDCERIKHYRIIALEDDTNNMTFEVSLVQLYFSTSACNKILSCKWLSISCSPWKGPDLTFLLRGMTFYMLFREKFESLCHSPFLVAIISKHFTSSSCLILFGVNAVIL